MKKYFDRIIISLLLAAIFPLTGAFCAQDFFHGAIKVAGSAVIEDADGCGGMVEMANSSQQKTISATRSSAGVLPCCSSGVHPEAITSFHQEKINRQLVAFILTPPADNPENIQKIAAIPAPLFPPPELVALQKTVLRL